MKMLGYASMAGVFACLFFGLAYFSIIMLLFSFHLSSESEMCKLRGVVGQLVQNQNAIMVAVRNGKSTNK